MLFEVGRLGEARGSGGRKGFRQFFKVQNAGGKNRSRRLCEMEGSLGAEGGRVEGQKLRKSSPLSAAKQVATRQIAGDLLAFV